MAVMSTETGRPPGRRGRYSKEFGRDAAAWILDQRRSVADVARELGVVEQTLGNWVRQERIDRGEKEGTSSDLRAENTRHSHPVARVGRIDTFGRRLSFVRSIHSFKPQHDRGHGAGWCPDQES